MMVTPRATAQQKEKERKESERLIKDFLERGGKIEIHKTEYDAASSLKAQHNQGALG